VGQWGVHLVVAVGKKRDGQKETTRCGDRFEPLFFLEALRVKSCCLVRHEWLVLKDIEHRRAFLLLVEIQA
jgi:hypothetical protein